MSCRSSFLILVLTTSHSVIMRKSIVAYKRYEYISHHQVEELYQ